MKVSERPLNGSPTKRISADIKMNSTTFEGISRFIRETYFPFERIALHEPRFRGSEQKYLHECIASTYVSSISGYVDKFAALVSDFCGTRWAVPVVNGSSGLHIALMLAGVSENDEVLTQPLTFIATVNAISYLKAHPVFIDVDSDTLGMSPYALQTYLNENARTGKDGILRNKRTNRRIAACLPVHTFGHPCRIDEIINVCNHYTIPVIEDAAEALGSYFKSRHTGTFGLMGVLSFNGNKIITTGGGGMILTDNEELARKARHLITQAKTDHPWEYTHDLIGYNYRLPGLNAALGCAQMESLPELLNAKRQLAKKYSYFFRDQDIKFFTEPENARSNYWLNTIIFVDPADRDAFLKYTNDSGIQTRPAWKLISGLEIYSSCERGNLKNAEWIENRLVNLPSSVV
jgi:perosamine synthetase